MLTGQHFFGGGFVQIQSFPTPQLFINATFMTWPSLAPNGSAGAPSYSFLNEPTSGLYRNGAGDIRLSILGTDVLIPALVTLAAFGTTPGLGIGIIPIRPFHIRTNGSANFSQIVLENPNTTDNVGQIIDFLSTTTGTVTPQVSFGNIECRALVHDFATRTSDFRFSFKNLAVTEQIQFKAGRIIQSDTGDIVLKSAAGNGNVVLTANGTGRVNITGGAAKLGCNTIEASTGAQVTCDATLFIPISAARFIRFGAGANQRAGNATLVTGTIAVGCTTITANSLIQLQRKTSGGIIGDLTYTLNAGVGFTINSSLATDTSVVSFFIIEVS